MQFQKQELNNSLESAKKKEEELLEKEDKLKEKAASMIDDLVLNAMQEVDDLLKDIKSRDIKDVKKEDIKWINELGIKDSKKMSDEQILAIVPRILKNVTYSLLTLDNVLYNKLVKRGFNMNKIKAYLHNKALLNLEAKCQKYISLFVVDQFTPEKNYYEYLKEEAKVVKRIEFVTKGESASPAVALSSILARYAFLRKMEQLREACGYNLPLGAGGKVDEIAKRILQEKGMDFLLNITKSNFKNFEKIK